MLFIFAVLIIANLINQVLRPNNLIYDAQRHTVFSRRSQHTVNYLRRAHLLPFT